jgi:hypothetical protein
MSSQDRSALSAAAGHYHAGRLTEAESLYRFRRAITLHPDSRVADRQLDRLLEQRGDPEGSAICYRRAARLRLSMPPRRPILPGRSPGKARGAEGVAHGNLVDARS